MQYTDQEIREHISQNWHHWNHHGRWNDAPTAIRYYQKNKEDYALNLEVDITARLRHADPLEKRDAGQHQARGAVVYQDTEFQNDVRRVKQCYADLIQEYPDLKDTEVIINYVAKETKLKPVWRGQCPSPSQPFQASHTPVRKGILMTQSEQGGRLAA